MASQIYSRYIPPPKKTSTKHFPVAKPSTKAISPNNPVATPPPIRQDPSSSYARYVPAPKTKVESTPKLSLSSKRDGDEVGNEPVSKRPKQENQEKLSKQKRTELVMHGNQGKQLEENRGGSFEMLEPKKSALRIRDSGGKHSAELQELGEVDSLQSLGVAGTDDGLAATTSKKERRKKKSKSSKGRADNANSDKFSDCGAKESLHGSDTPKRRNKTRENSDNTFELDEGVGTDAKDVGSRHKKLMEKREKSLKKAERFVQETTTESAGENLELGPVEELPTHLHDLVPLPQPDPVLEPPIVYSASSLPSWLSSPIRVSPTATKPFSEVGIEDCVAKMLRNMGFNEAFAVQGAVLPLLLPGKLHQYGDVLVSAATGSGKTLAYVLPMIEDISRSQTTQLRGLIIMPTRELVTQVKEVCEICASAFQGVLHRKRVKIGTAVGSETLKVEQNLLMGQELLYDRVEYENQERRLNTKWISSDYESDEELFCDEETIAALPDHVFHSVSKVDILICTPGRLVEHIKSTPGFTLKKIKWLVVDEADKLLDQSFQQWLGLVMARIAKDGSSTGPTSPVRKIILSATMTRDIGLLNPLKLYRPTLVVLERSASTEDSQKPQASQAHVLPLLLLESGVKVEDENIKPLYLMELMKREYILSPSPVDDSSSVSKFSEVESSSNETPSRLAEYPVSEGMPTSELDPPKGVLIFTKSNESAVRLSRLISLLAPSWSRRIGTLTSTTPRASRKSTLRSFAAGKMTILVASDLVSRGLDLPNLAHVVNYDIPTSLTNYVHRIGRTARAGKRGHAWTLYTGNEGRWFWNEIGRTEGVERSSGQVKRVNIKADVFDEERRRRYEEALDILGREALNLNDRG